MESYHQVFEIFLDPLKTQQFQQALLLRQMQGGRGGAMGFGRSKAKLLTENKNKVTFNDVAE